ncbi:MAG: host attachment family protein [Rhizobiaceae bacterium]
MGFPRLAKRGYILVADGARAKLLSNLGTAEEPDLRVVREYAQDNPVNSQQGSERPGRLSDGASLHRSAVEETDYHRLAKDRFAAMLVGELEGLASEGKLRQCILVAPPQVLGTLRKAVGAQLASCVIGDVNKDLTTHEEREIARIVLGT